MTKEDQLELYRNAITNTIKETVPRHDTRYGPMAAAINGAAELIQELIEVTVKDVFPDSNTTDHAANAHSLASFKMSFERGKIGNRLYKQSMP